MKIYVYNCSNTFNYGSMMMGENFISYFNQITGTENDYYVETDDEINVERLKSAVLSDRIDPVPFNSLLKKDFSKYDHLLSQVRLKKPTSDFAECIDMVVVLGGDDFTEDYGWKSPLMYAVQFNLLRREGIKVVMVGQTMGPFHSFRRPLMKSLLRNIDKIYPRERLTYQYLMNLGLQNITLTDDLALLPLARQEPKESTEEYITFCPSELIYRYCKEEGRGRWIAFNLFMIEVLLMRYPDKKILLLAHVLKPESVDDRMAVNELYDLLKDQYKERLIPVSRELYPYEVRNFIQQSFLLVSARMHATVSAFQCGKPAITYSYSSKSFGIIGDRYGLGEYIIDVRALDYSEMKEVFVCLLDRLEDEYPLVIEKIRHRNGLVQKSILCALEEIRDLSSSVPEEGRPL